MIKKFLLDTKSKRLSIWGAESKNERKESKIRIFILTAKYYLLWHLRTKRFRRRKFKMKRISPRIPLLRHLKVKVLGINLWLLLCLEGLGKKNL
jgi:hypothetical protein